MSGGLELLDSAQSGQDALARLVVGADRLDQLQVAITTNAFKADRHSESYWHSLLRHHIDRINDTVGIFKGNLIVCWHYTNAVLRQSVRGISQKPQKV